MDPASGCGEHIIDHRHAAFQQVAECWARTDLSPTAPAHDAGWIFAKADYGSNVRKKSSGKRLFSFIRLAGTGGRGGSFLKAF